MEVKSHVHYAIFLLFFIFAVEVLSLTMEV